MGLFSKKTDIRTHLRKQGRLDAQLAEEKAYQAERVVQAKKKGRMRAMPAKGASISSGFGSFQDFATRFAQSQQPQPMRRKPMKRKMKKRK